MFLDPHSGALLETRDVRTVGDASNPSGMATFGSTLAISARRTMEILE